MTYSDDSANPGGVDAARFATTHWSMVAVAGESDSPASRQALQTLCQTYWYPLYAYVRRRGYSSSDAADLVQEFFASLLGDDDYLRSADPQRGKFRSFLLASCKNFLAKQERRKMAAKRGGGAKQFSLDFTSGEERYRREPSHDLTPEAIYVRRWALMLLEHAFSQLRAEFSAIGRLELYDALKVFLGGDRPHVTYRDLADRLGMTEGAVKVAAHRLRCRYRELLRAEIAQTVASQDELEEELQELFRAVGGKNV